MNLFSISSYLADQNKKRAPKKPVIKAKVSNAGVAYGVLGPTQSRTSFQISEYNLGEISKVMDIESYVRQAFNKHVELCLKEGYDIASRNEEATNYIKRRIREMTEVSGVTFDMLLRSILQNIVAYSNAFIVKVRDAGKSTGAPIKRAVGDILPPIAAYFPMDPTSMRVKRDWHGKVLKYWQRVPGNPVMPQFIPENIIHIYYDRKEGFAFGTPYIVPVLDDIRSLRRLEENVEMLMNAHLFPLYHYKVGTETAPAEIYDDGTTEVDVIKDQIEAMPTEGSIVTPERHEITNLGAQGKAIDATDYLKYFERRVLAGLGISDIALGRGDTANRATAVTIDKSMVDRCKDFQAVVEGFINEFMFKELLYEGGFVVDEKEDNFVKINFREIDIDSMLKSQNHTIFKYEHHAITETEMRDEISKDPISDAQREDMYFERVQKPLVEAEGAVQLKIKETMNREKPTNQHGTKPAKTTAKKDSNTLAANLDHLWHMTKLDIIDMVNDMPNWKEINIEKIRPIVNMTYEEMLKGASGLRVNKKELDNGIQAIFNDLGDVLCRSVSCEDVRGNLVYKISGVFETLRPRLNDLSNKSIISEEATCQ